MKPATSKPITTAAAMMLGVLSAPSMAAHVDVYLKIPDIEGESQRVGYEGAIDVLSWSWGTSQAEGQGKNAGTCVDAMSLAKNVDRASAGLITAAMVGARYDSAVLSVVQSESGAPALEIISIKMRDVSISDFRTGGERGDPSPVDGFSLNFAEAEWVYTEQADDLSPGRVTRAYINSTGTCR